MPNNPINITNVTPPRVPLTDARTGLISREWYRFFLNMFQLVGNGQNDISLLDVQYAPIQNTAGVSDTGNPAISPDPNPSDLRSDYAELQKQVYGLEMGSKPQLGTMAQLQQAWLPWVTFDTAPEITPTNVGTVAWDGGTTLGVQMTSNVLGRVNESGYYYIKASSAITKGDVVMFTGAVGASGVPTGAPATGVTDGSYIMGVAAESMALNAFGLVQFQGTLRGVNLSAYADGDILWYNPAVTGGLTKTKPSAPNVKVQMAAVISASNNGTMLIRVTAGSELGGTDSNVQFGTLATNDLIQYNGTYWTNVAPSSVSIGTATNLAGGAAGSVPYQSAASTTTFLGIGTAGQFLKVNSGATAPQWASPAALTKTDDTNVTLTLGGSASTALLNAASLTLGWTGQLAISRGGTGVNTTPSNGQLLIGNGTGYTVANLTAGSGVTITNSAGGISISATGTGGTVTSVGLSMPSQFTVTNSPVTGSGTLTAAWNNQTANYIFAGPTTGAAAAPTFRALVAGDIPSLSYVTSVGATAPITSTGGLTPTIGVTAAALTKTDDTNVTMTLGGSPTTALLAATSLTLGWTGQLAVSRGGTGLSSLTNGGIPYATSTSALTTSTELTYTSAAGLSVVNNLSVGNSAAYTNNFYFKSLYSSTTYSASIGNNSEGVYLNSVISGGLSLSYNTGTVGATNQAYVVNGYASGILINNGITFKVAASGTAGNIISFITAASFDNTGNLNLPLLTASKALFTDASKNVTTTGTLGIAQGGTGVTTTPTNGQLLIGNGSGYTVAALTASTGISITNSAGGISIASTSQPVAAPVTQTANFSVGATDVWIINNKSGSSCTATLPAASSYTGRVLHFQNYQAQTLVSASSNVVQITGGAATTSILLASSGDQCTLVSDGTNWIMTQYTPNNSLLLE